MTRETLPDDGFDGLVRWIKILACVTALAVGALSIGLFVAYSVNAGKNDKLEEATAALKAQREADEKDRLERSIGSCKQQNASFIHDHNELVRKDQKNWLTIAAALDSAEGKKFITDIAKSYDTNIIPPRVCTEAGIEAYLKGKGLGG